MRRVLLLTALAACTSTLPLQPMAAEAVLVEARRQIAAGELAAARDQLTGHGKSEFGPTHQAEYEILLARAQLGLGEPWNVYQTLRNFADDHPHSELREQAVDLQFQAGAMLSQSDAGFLFFWSDKRGARTCLEHLITRYPTSAHVADALRILGELAMARGDFEEAEERFRDLLRRHPESEWAPLARFRFAMSIFASLRGPDYDLEKMQSATKELRVFLDNPPENPAFLADAQAAYDQLLSWRAERHWRIAAFYRRVGNRAGELAHLRAAAAPEFAHTEAARAALEQLGQLGEALPPPPDGGTR